MVFGVVLAAFVDVTATVGLADVHPSRFSPSSSAIAFVDLDHDGWSDLYIPQGEGQDELLCRNLGGSFACEAVGAEPNVVDTNAVAYGDFDNDGDDDILVAGTAGWYLWRNDDGALVDVTTQAGLDLLPDRKGLDLALGDWDGDGWLDAYLGVEWALDDTWRGDLLLRNDGAGGFVWVPDAGIDTSRSTGHGQGVIFFDFDDDGDQDVYRGTDRIPDYFFVNQGDGTFVQDMDHGERFGQHTLFAMGIDAGDFDRDGDLDLYLSDGCEEDPFGEVSNTLYVDLGGGVYDNQAVELGVEGFWSWSVGWEDFDSDGWPDLLVTGARTCFYHNDQATGFTADCVVVTDGGGRCNQTGDDQSYSSAAGDYDRDGDVDVAVVDFDFDSEGGGNVILWENVGPQGNWLRIRLQGTVSNRSGIGSKIFVTDATVTWRRDWLGPTGHGSQREPWLHFGLGTADLVDVEVRWPSGAIQEVADVAVNQDIVVVEPECGADTCGNDCCGPAEDTCNCVEDCGTVCGDDCCTGEEDCVSCPSDCQTCPEPSPDMSPDVAVDAPVADGPPNPPDMMSDAPVDGTADAGSPDAETPSDSGVDGGPAPAWPDTGPSTRGSTFVAPLDEGCQCVAGRTPRGTASLLFLALSLAIGVRRRSRLPRSQ